MASGLAALLDDVAAIAKLAAASLDDVSAAAGKASSKAAGVVIDDTAVTPAYVTGFSPQRELPIIGRIALGSLRNKLLILLPVALLLSAVLPAAITPLLMLGGAYLSFEGAEKILEWLGGGEHEAAAADMPQAEPAQIEAARISGAIRTDLILSAEIMAISLADVASRPVMIQAGALIVVSLLVTAGVYGVVALIVKLDDIGLHLAGRRSGAVRATGRALVRFMPHVLSLLSTIGMIAMLWVGGGIILHGLDASPLAALPHALHRLAGMIAQGGPLGWLINALLAALVALALGLVLTALVHGAQHLRRRL